MFEFENKRKSPFFCLRKVFFPDVERAEWVNRILKQAWPYANKYLDKEIFRAVLVPLIRGTAPALGDFSFEKLDLGEIVAHFELDFHFKIYFLCSHQESEVSKFIQTMFEIK